MGNCAGKDSGKMVANTEQLAKEAEDNEEPHVGVDQPVEGDDKETVNEGGDKEKAKEDVVVKKADPEPQGTDKPNADDDEADEVEVPDMEVIGKKVNIKAEIQATTHTEDEEPKLTESEAEEIEENKIEAPKEEENKKEDDHVAELTNAVSTATIEPKKEDIAEPEHMHDEPKKDAQSPKKDEIAKKEPKDEWVEILDPDQVRKEWADKAKELTEPVKPIQATPNAELDCHDEEQQQEASNTKEEANQEENNQEEAAVVHED